MNKIYERMAELMLEDRNDPPLHISALHHRYRMLRDYMRKNHPEMNHPHTRASRDFASRVPVEKYLKRSGK